MPKGEPFTSYEAVPAKTTSAPIITKTIINHIIKHVPVYKTVEIRVPHPIPIPIYEPFPVAVPHPIYINIPQSIEPPALQPFHVKAEKPYPVELPSTTYPVPLDNQEPFEVKNHVPVEVPKQFPVSQDYYKHLYHNDNTESKF